eukprot:CAMPEP_0116963484 /NCGR_PEP_ID=MMETSP0467-20121206/47946_1 /TAXON_ID=283647 /ORGANISM="Mesodinium pulex, Strain SPMC105" /LENGTH=119 /DNA_ID=CAMNT_0004652137 /DNA_START=233 /DNA_END=589 /DNA_ORIENTATION=-
MTNTKTNTNNTNFNINANAKIIKTKNSLIKSATEIPSNIHSDNASKVQELQQQLQQRTKDAEALEAANALLTNCNQDLRQQLADLNNHFGQFEAQFQKLHTQHDLQKTKLQYLEKENSY